MQSTSIIRAGIVSPPFSMPHSVTITADGNRLKINMPAVLRACALAATYGSLGEQERARSALRAGLALVPDFGALARRVLR